MWWRWTITAIGAAALRFTLLFSPGSGDDGAAIALAVGSVFLLIGVAALLPWVVERIVERLHGGPPSWQLAVRRLQLDSGTASRVVSGLVVVLAGSILVQGVTSALGSNSADRVSPVGAAAAPVRVATTAAHQTEVIGLLKGAPGVTGVHASRSISFDSDGHSLYGVVGDCVALRVEQNLGDCKDGDVFYVVANSSPAPTGAVRLSGYREGKEVPGGEWTIPGTVKTVVSDTKAKASTGTLLVTPGALGGAKVPDARTVLYVSGTGSTDALLEQASIAVQPLLWNAEVSRSDFYAAYASSSEKNIEDFRTVLLTASLFVLAVAAMSLLMLSIEQISERRRPLAALSAAGVPMGVLARGSLWQTAVPVVVGVVLAVGAGIGLTAPILRLANLDMALDGAVLGGLAAAAVAAVLLVTALTLPLLRQVTRLDGLRAE
jgi:hypothetical protein